MGRKMIDETGKRYNRLVAIEYVRKYATKNNDHSDSIWLCKCDCGNAVEVLGTNLRKGISSSCGCYGREQQKKAVTLPTGEAAFNCLHAYYKSSAKKRKLKWRLSRNQFREIIQQNCIYCGAIPSNICKKSDLNGAYVYSGIDRVDNSRGYIKDNCVPCCKDCNTKKGSITLDIIFKVYELVKADKEK